MAVPSTYTPCLEAKDKQCSNKASRNYEGVVAGIVISSTIALTAFALGLDALHSITLGSAFMLFGSIAPTNQAASSHSRSSIPLAARRRLTTLFL